MAVSNVELTIERRESVTLAAALLKQAARRDDSIEQGNWR
jgi:hypothetical protein